MPAIVLPSLLSADLTMLKAELDAFISAGITHVHYDVMDGHFAQGGHLTFGDVLLQQLTRLGHQFFWDVHLMVTNPGTVIEQYQKAGASSLTVHWEALGEDTGIFAKIKSYGMKAGVAINPNTELNVLEPLIKESWVDLVLLMTVEPGASGKGFDPKAPERMVQVGRMLSGTNIVFEVDGSIKATDDPATNTAQVARSAGAKWLVSGSGFFTPGCGVNSDSYATAARRLAGID